MNKKHPPRESDAVNKHDMYRAYRDNETDQWVAYHVHLPISSEAATESEAVQNARKAVIRYCDREEIVQHLLRVIDSVSIELDTALLYGSLVRGTYDEDRDDVDVLLVSDEFEASDQPLDYADAWDYEYGALDVSCHPWQTVKQYNDRGSIGRALREGIDLLEWDIRGVSQSESLDKAVEAVASGEIEPEIVIKEFSEREGIEELVWAAVARRECDGESPSESLSGRDGVWNDLPFEASDIVSIEELAEKTGQDEEQIRKDARAAADPRFSDAESVHSDESEIRLGDFEGPSEAKEFDSRWNPSVTISREISEYLLDKRHEVDQFEKLYEDYGERKYRQVIRYAMLYHLDFLGDSRASFELEFDSREEHSLSIYCICKMSALMRDIVVDMDEYSPEGYQDSS